jgi:hypothetical protein
MVSRRAALGLVAILATWLAWPAAGTDIQVSTGVTATDTGACGVGANPPCRTIGFAIGTRANGCPQPDRVLLADGTYDTANGDAFPVMLKDCVSVIGNNADPTMVLVEANAANTVFAASGSLTKSTLSGMTIRPGVTTISSIVFRGDGIVADSLAAFDAVTAVIEKNRFEGGRDGVRMHNDDDFGNAVNVSPIIRNNRFTMLADDAVQFSVNDGGPGQMLAPEISSNTMSSLGGHGIDLFMSDCEGTNSPLIRKNVITGTDDEGILLSFSDLSAEGGGAALVIAAPMVISNTVMNADSEGIAFNWTEQSSGDVTSGFIKIEPTITGNTVTDVDGDGIQVSITEFTATSAVDDLVLLIDATITGNTVTDADSDGIDLSVIDIEDFDSGLIQVNATISGNMVSGNGETGIRLALASWTDDMTDVNINVALAIDDNTVTGNERRGIDVEISDWDDMESAQVAVGGTISGNTVSDNGTSTADTGIRLRLSDWSDIANSGGSLAPILFTIADNTVTGNAGPGIVAEALDINTSVSGFEFNVMLTNNTVTGNGGPASGIDIRFTDSGAVGSAMLNNNTVAGNDGPGVLIELVGISGTVAGGPVNVALRDNVIYGHLADAVKINAGNGVVTATNYAIDLGGGPKGGPGGNKFLGDTMASGGQCAGGGFCDINNNGPNDVWAECNQFTSNNLITEEDWLRDEDDDNNLGQITDTFCLITCTTNADCNDGLFCNGVETCDAADPGAGPDGCVPGTPPDCSDAFSCTTDSCDEQDDECDHTPVDSVCDDSMACNGAEFCDVDFGCQNGMPIDCDDSVACTLDACIDPAGTCDHTPDDAACDDGNVCTDDTCNTITDCNYANNSNGCDDGQFCNGSDTCAGGVCTHTGDPCLGGPVCADTCDELNDICSAPPCTACDDGDGSTHNDHCVGGMCVGNSGPAVFGPAVTQFSVLGVDATSVQLNAGAPTTVIGDACARGTTFGKNSSISGRVIATRKSGTAAQFLGGGSVAKGIFTGGGSIIKGVPPVISPTFDTSNGPPVTTCKKAATLVGQAAMTIADPTAACTTNPLSNIVIPLGGMSTLTVTAGQLNIFRLTNLDVGMNGKLIINATGVDPNTSVVINVDGIFRVRRAAMIVAGAGLTARQILFNVAGVGGTATVDRDAMVEATLLAADRDISIGQMAVMKGGVWGGASTIGVGPGALIDNKTFNRTLP